MFLFNSDDALPRPVAAPDAARSENPQSPFHNYNNKKNSIKIKFIKSFLNN